MKYKILLETEDENTAYCLFHTLMSFSSMCLLSTNNMLIHRGYHPTLSIKDNFAGQVSCGGIPNKASFSVVNDFIGREDGTIIRQTIYNDIGDNLLKIEENLTKLMTMFPDDILLQEIDKLVQKIKG